MISLQLAQLHIVAKKVLQSTLYLWTNNQNENWGKVLHSDEIENPFSEELDDSLPNSNSQGRCVMLYAFGGIDIKRGILILIISAAS
jgi:hypothetical protein